MKKFLTWILVLTMLVSCLGLLSCATENDKPEKENPKKEKGKEGEETVERIKLDLPEKDYGGMEYHVLEWSANGQETVGTGWLPWEEIDVEEYDGDTIGKAVYARNAAVEEAYKVEITKEYSSVDLDFPAKIRTNNDTGEDAYQLITFRTVGVVSYIKDGFLFDMNEYEGTIFHFDQPWWVQDSIDSFKLGSHQFLASSEVLLRDKGATAAIYFNQHIANEYSLGNLYDLVENNEWTLEEMTDLSEIVYSSMDGDDLMNSKDDMWGCVSNDDTIFYLFNGAGRKFAHIDDEGYFQYDFGYDEDSIIVIKEIFDDYMYGEFFYNTYSGKLGEEIKGAFKADHSLFNTNLIKATMGLRDMESDYGILPAPKYSEDQENYSSLVWQHHDCILGIPAAVGDAEMAAIILEALSWESYYMVYPEFYDTVLMDRSTRDDQSKAMLKIIFDTRSYDPGQYWDSKSSLQNAILRLSATRASDVASLWEKNRSAVEESVALINDWVDNNW